MRVPWLPRPGAEMGNKAAIDDGHPKQTLARGVGGMVATYAHPSVLLFAGSENWHVKLVLFRLLRNSVKEFLKKRERGLPSPLPGPRRELRRLLGHRTTKLSSAMMDVRYGGGSWGCPSTFLSLKLSLPPGSPPALSLGHLPSCDDG